MGGRQAHLQGEVRAQGKLHRVFRIFTPGWNLDEMSHLLQEKGLLEESCHKGHMLPGNECGERRWEFLA